MYYDLRPNTTWNGAFMPHTYDILPAYWALYYWAELADFGTQVKSDCAEKDIYTTAARSADGKLRLLLTRYNEDDSVKDLKEVTVSVPQGYRLASVRLTDSQKELDRKLEITGDTFTLILESNAVALIEFI